MNRVVSALFLAIGLTIVLPSCQKAPVLSVSGLTNIDISADGGSSSAAFTTNRDWSVSWSESWVHVSPSSGSASDGPITVTLRCDANTTYEERSATITIKAEDLSQTLTVRQPANLGLIVPTKSYELTSSSNSIEVEVQANVQYSVSASDSWIKQTSTKGLTKSILVFSVSENTTYDTRSASITIKSQSSGVPDQVVTVRQAQKDALIVNDSNYNLPYGGGGVEVKVEANVEFDVLPSVDWIHYVSTKALSGSTVSLTVDENKTYASRTGKVVIKQKNGNLTHTVTVNQAGRIAVTSITLNKTSLTLQEGGSETLIATVKPDNATDKTVTWSSSNTSVATVDVNGNVTAVKEGTVTITVRTNEGGKIADCYITVKPVIQYVIFEDANFKAYCIKAFDTDGDWELSLTEAAAITGLIVSNKNFTSLKGLEYFTGIQSLRCAGNQLTNLDLSKNILLKTLDCQSNLLTSLDVSNNTELLTLVCNNNRLTSLDVSKNIKLKSLICNNNQLTSLDVSENRMLDGLNCNYNQLESLDLSKNLRLVNLQCDYNQLTSLDVSKNSELRLLYCERNLLTSLDVSKNKLNCLRCNYNQLTNLVTGDIFGWVECYGNKLINLDVSKSTRLQSLYCYDNLLTSLDVNNMSMLRNLDCHRNQLTTLDVSQNTRLELLHCASNPFLTEIWLKTGQKIENINYDSSVTKIKYKD